MNITDDVLSAVLIGLCVLLLVTLVALAYMHRAERLARRMSFDDVEKQEYFSSTTSDTDASRPSSPIPEIRLTFPDDAETDASKQVIVEVGEAGCAFVREVPELDGFEDLDLEMIGGLKDPHARPSSPQ